MSTPYDEILYPTFSHAQLHPDRLSIPAWLMGLDPAPAEACRYLELGCGDGGTVLALAMALPDSEFVGVDLAPTAVLRGRHVAEAVGLTNVTLIQADVADLPGDLGDFDYIVCHGVFSWVPEAARQGILRASKERLRPQGVAYLSYNANPAGLLREMTRQMLRFHLRRGQRTPEEKLAEAHAFMGFLTSARPEGDPWRRLVESEIAHLETRLPTSLVHDELAEVNTPYWLYEVLDLADEHGLRFLSEADDLGDHSALWPDHVAKLLQALEDEPETKEQYLDFLVARRFRQTLLCHADRLLDRPIRPSRIADLDVVASVAAEPETVDLSPGVNVNFVNASGVVAGTDMAIGKAALEHLGERWPAAVAFPELLAEVRSATAAWRGRRGEHDDGEELARFLVRLHGAGIVQMRRHRPPWPHRLEDVDECPLGSPLARHQAELGHGVATLLAEVVELDDILRHVLSLCDGVSDRETLAARLGEVAELPDGTPAGRESIDDALSSLARLALLVR